MSDFERLMERVGENIKRLRQINEMTQVQLAEKTQRPQSSIARVEGATYGDASLSLIFDLCSSLQVSLSDLFGSVEGKKTFLASQRNKGALETKWERTKARVDRLTESERDWVADVVNTILRDHSGKL